jgi:hypothetical protein
MSVRVELFCEDSAHESCARALVQRIADDAQVGVSMHTATASSGVGRLKQELRAYQSLISRRPGTPDLLIVVIDSNAVGPTARRSEISQILDTHIFPEVVIGTPNPCVERWLLADPKSFTETFGVQPVIGRPSTRDAWKNRLVTTLEAAGELLLQGGAELADEIIKPMDFYRAGKADQTILTFTDDLRHALRRLDQASPAPSG